MVSPLEAHNLRRARAPRDTPKHRIAKSPRNRARQNYYTPSTQHIIAKHLPNQIGKRAGELQLKPVKRRALGGGDLLDGWHISARQHPALKAKFFRLDQAPGRLRHRAHLTGQPDLAEHDQLAGDGSVEVARQERDRDAQVGGWLVDARAAGDVYEHVLAGDLKPGALLDDV